MGSSRNLVAEVNLETTDLPTEIQAQELDTWAIPIRQAAEDEEQITRLLDGDKEMVN